MTAPEPAGGPRKFTRQEHGQRLALIDAFDDVVAQGGQQVRAAAAADMAALLNDDGTPSFRVRVDGRDVGLVKVTPGAKTTKTHGATLMELACEPHQREAGSLADHVNPTVLTERPDVVALIKEHFPELVTEEITDAWRSKVIKRAALKSQASGGEGVYLDEATGTAYRIQSYSRGPADGKVTYTPASADAVAEVMAAWRDGRLDPSLVPQVFPAITAGAPQEARVFPMPAAPAPGDEHRFPALTRQEEDALNADAADLSCGGHLPLAHDRDTNEVTCQQGHILRPGSGSWEDVA